MPILSYLGNFLPDCVCFMFWISLGLFNPKLEILKKLGEFNGQSEFNNY